MSNLLKSYLLLIQHSMPLLLCLAADMSIKVEIRIHANEIASSITISGTISLMGPHSSALFPSLTDAVSSSHNQVLNLMLIFVKISVAGAIF